MPYLILALDHPGMEEERELVREEHRRYLADFGKQLLASGALLDEADGSVIGGASLLDTDDYEEAKRFESGDPYAMAGIRQEVNIIPWRLRWWTGEFDQAGHHPSETET